MVAELMMYLSVNNIKMQQEIIVLSLKKAHVSRFALRSFENSLGQPAISLGFCIQESLGLPRAFFGVPLTELGTRLIFCASFVKTVHL